MRHGTHPLVEAPPPAQLLSRPCVSNQQRCVRSPCPAPASGNPTFASSRRDVKCSVDDWLGQKVGDGTFDRGTSRADNEQRT